MSNWKTVVFALQILQPCHNKISRSPGLKIHIESVHLRKKMKNNSHSNSNSRVDKDMPEASGSGCSKPLGSNTKDPTCWEWFWCWEYTLFLCFFQASTPDLCLNLVCLTQLNMILSILNAKCCCFLTGFWCCVKSFKRSSFQLFLLWCSQSLPILRGKFRISSS